MITSGFNPFTKKELKDNRKKKLLGAILKSRLYKPPYLIWATFINDIHIIHSYLSSLGFKGAMLYGATKAEARKRIIKGFQEGKYDYLVAHPIVLGIGVTLVRSNVCIYYSNSFRFEDNQRVSGG
jgi:superfamily II DNA/RNA helicase